MGKALIKQGCVPNVPTLVFYMGTSGSPDLLRILLFPVFPAKNFLAPSPLG